jgi:hypothetical protein
VADLLAKAWALAALLGLVACGGAATRGELAGRARLGNLSQAGLTVRTSDLNGDGRPDQWHYTAPGGGVLVRVERDINFDGRVDVYEHYDEAGRLVEQEMQLDFDERIDVVRYYRDGVLVRRELATGFDGRFTLVKVYDGSGNTLRVEHDTDGDGRIDSWEYFEEGRVVSAERDTNGDGRPDTRDF